MKVKIIEKETQYDLEASVNEYLSSYDCSKIFDIKYTGCGSWAPYGIRHYSAMIILK